MLAGVLFGIKLKCSITILELIADSHRPSRRKPCTQIIHHFWLHDVCEFGVCRIPSRDGRLFASGCSDSNLTFNKQKCSSTTYFKKLKHSSFQIPFPSSSLGTPQHGYINQPVVAGGAAATGTPSIAALGPAAAVAYATYAHPQHQQQLVQASSISSPQVCTGYLM